MSLKKIYLIVSFLLGLLLQINIHASNLLYDEVDLSITSPNYSDRVRVRLNEVSTNGYDIGLDAIKFLSANTAVPQFYSQMVVSGSTYKLSVNSLPRNVNGVTNIPLAIRYGEKGTYTITAADVLARTPNCTQVYLIDSISTSNKTTVDLRAISTYSFTYSGNANVTTATRFKLRISSAVPYVAIASNSPNISCAYPSVTLTANATAGCTYLWSTGATTPSISVSNAGNYSVTVTRTVTGLTATDTKSIGSNLTTPSVNITLPYTELTCAITNIRLTSHATNVSYLWSNGNTNSTIDVTTPGNYVLTVTDLTNGCTNTAAQNISQNITPPSLEVSLPTSELTCTINSINLQASSSGNVYYAWSTEQTNSEITVSDPGDYSITVTDVTTLCSATTTNTISKNIIPPSVEITTSGSQITCGVSSLELNAVAENVSYLWSTGEEVSTIDVSNSGDYTLMVTDLTNGCTNSATKTVTKDVATPSVSINSPATEFSCEYPSIELSADALNVSYLWSTNEITPNIIVSDAGSYSLTVTDLNNGCQNTASQSLDVPVVPQNAYYETRVDGSFSDMGLWQFSDGAANWQCTKQTPNENAVSVVLLNQITTSSTDDIKLNNIEIDSSGKLFNQGTVTVNDTLTFVVNANGVSSQLLNKGTVINNGVIRVRRSFRSTDGWVFISFPFDVSAQNIFISGTNTIALWGNIGDTGKTFYVAEYDGAKRDQTGSSSSTNGQNWKSVNPHILYAKKGYIIAAESDITLDFMSNVGEDGLFNSSATEVVNRYTTNALPVHHNWNLLGVPFSSSFDLLDASQDQAPFYYYDGMQYQTVMQGDSYEAYPFTAFFLQGNPAATVPTSLSFGTSGRILKSVYVPNFDEIGLVVKNAKYSDKVRIRLQEGAGKVYELGKDAVKFFAPKAEMPQIFCKEKGENLSVANLPANTTKVELSVKIGESGMYTISLEDIAKVGGCSQVILEDGDLQTDLLSAGSYSFAGTVGSTKNLSVLLVPAGNTLTTSEGSTIVIKSVADKAYISGLQEAATVNVYDLAGKLVQSFTNVSNDQALKLKAKGVCIIDVKTLIQKAKARIFVKK